MNIIDQKLIDAYTILVLRKIHSDLTIAEIVDEVGVQEKYKQDVEVKVAERIVEVLGDLNED